jgi:molecular chaperone HscB
MRIDEAAMGKEQSGGTGGTTAGSMPLPCWSCHGPVGQLALFCHVCGAVQAPRALDPFSRLGFEPRFDLDAAEIDRRYRGLQQRLHPDRFAARSPRERALAESQAMSLNEAYETLKDPLQRGAALLERAGHRSPIGENRTIDDPALLAEAMEAREALSDAADLAAVEALARRAREADAACLAGLAAAFGEGATAKAATLLTRLKYWRKLGEEIRGRRAVLAQGAG